MKGLKERLLRNKEEGQALVIAIVLLVAMELMGFTLTTISEVDASTAGNLIRVEQALYGAEQGVIAGIDWTMNPANSLAVGSSVRLNSIDYRGKYYNKYVEGTIQEPFPRWSSVIINLGQVPGALSEKLLAYRYQVESQGFGGVTLALGTAQSAHGLVKMQRVEYGLINYTPYPLRGGQKLAYTGY